MKDLCFKHLLTSIIRYPELCQMLMLSTYLVIPDSEILKSPRVMPHMMYSLQAWFKQFIHFFSFPVDTTGPESRGPRDVGKQETGRKERGLSLV